MFDKNKIICYYKILFTIEPGGKPMTANNCNLSVLTDEKLAEELLHRQKKWVI